MKCPRCQQENRAGRKFCSECGASLALACPSCGFSNESGEKFCGGCGTSLLAPAAPRFVAPESYTPKHLADRILTSKAALEGERKQVTVLFADLKGSMELLADRDPEEARKILDPIIERMMEAVHRYEGTVNQVLGDGIMALFGAPLAHEDHAVRACYAALAMQDRVKRYAEDMRRVHGVEVQIRVGLNSGDVVVRSIGSDLRMDYTAVGQTTHLAARMEQLALPGTIRLTGDTMRLAEGYVEVRSLGPIPVKGLPDPIEIFELTSAGMARTRLQAAALRGLTRFVGREAEVEQLRRVLGQAGSGRGQVVAIVGEAGVGKSRLTYEFTHSHRVQEWLILEASSVSYGKATSYLPVIDLLKGYFKIGDRDDHREMRAKVLGRVLGLDRGLEPLLPPLLALLDVPVEDEGWQRLDPLQRRQRTLDAVKRVLLRESQVQPLLVVFEDLHWIDAETQALLDGLVESLPTARLLLLVNYRPEYQHGWASKTYYNSLRLHALPPESAGELLQALLGDDPALASLKQLLVRRGNPFFIEESIRMLLETGALVGERGACRLTRPIQAIEVPATVQVILAARFDRLAADDKHVLQTAAVIGKDVLFALLRAVAEATEDVVQRGLAHLQAAEFLYETRLFPDLEYTFKHALTHEVTYGTVLHERRKALHARIVDALERSYPDRLSEHVDRLAHHAVRGETWDKAVTYSRQAGLKASARSANREAVACFEQALTALSRLAETPDTLAQAIDIRLDLIPALFALAEFERSLAYLREAEGLATTLGDQRRLGRVCVLMCHHFVQTWHLREALQFGRRTHGLAETLDDVSLAVTGSLYLGVAMLYTGEHRQAEDLFRKVLQVLEGDRSRERFGLAGYPAVLARGYLVWVLVERGEFEEGIAHGREGIRLAEALDHPYSLTFVCWALAYLHLIRRDLADAAVLFERGRELAREWNLRFFSAIHTLGLAYVYANSGRGAGGISLLEEAARTVESVALELVPFSGEAYVLADQIEKAGELASRSLTFARERGLRIWEGWVLRILGDVAAQRDAAAHAEAQYRDALTLGKELGQRPHLAHCHLALAKLYRRTDNREQAREHLATAMTMYREMGMTYWLGQAEAEMR